MSSALPSRRAVLGGTAIAMAGCTAVQAGALPGDDALRAALDAAMADGSTSVLVMRSDQILAERYAPGWSADRPREVASVAKSIVAILIGMAMEDGFITSLDRSASDFIPAWRDDDRRAITLHHLLTMTSGLNDAGLALRGVTGDQLAINAAAPLRDPPGTKWAYNTAAYHLLFHVVARATGERFETYAERRLLGPLGMTDTSWVTNEGRTEAGPTTNYYSAVSTARDLATFGRLILSEGRWNGRRLISADFVRRATSPSQALNPSYGLLWWSNARPGYDAFGRGPALRFPRSPRDTIAALGAGGQLVLLAPSSDLVIVRQGVPFRSATLGDDLILGAIDSL